MGHNKAFKRAVTIATICFTMALSGCASQNDSNVVKESVAPTIVETQQLTEQDTIESESQNMTTETETESTNETPVEMVDWETWAKQEANDDVCMVVWNENLGIQEIMPTVQETKKSYVTQEGDKFAIPYRESIVDIKIGDETAMWINTEYLEVSVSPREKCQVIITYEVENGEYENINYMFK